LLGDASGEYIPFFSLGKYELRVAHFWINVDGVLEPEGTYVKQCWKP